MSSLFRLLTYIYVGVKCVWFYVRKFIIFLNKRRKPLYLPERRCDLNYLDLDRVALTAAMFFRSVKNSDFLLRKLALKQFPYTDRRRLVAQPVLFVDQHLKLTENICFKITRKSISVI